MELTKAEVFRRKSFLVSITNDIKSYLETTTPTPPPVSYENCFYIAETTKCLTDYIINNNDVKLAKEILEIDMSLWDKEKGYLDLDPFCKKGWEILRQIEKVEKNISLLRDWYNNNSTQTAHKQDSTEPQQELKDMLPEILKKDEAVIVFQKAIDAKLIIQTLNGLEWMDTKQLLAYFVTKLNKSFPLSNKTDTEGNKITMWKPFETLFKKSDLKGAKQNWMRVYTKFEPTGFEKVDALF